MKESNEVEKSILTFLQIEKLINMACLNNKEWVVIVKKE